MGMECEICGVPLERAGQAHTCRTGRAAPSPAAETFLLAARRVIRFGVVYAAVVVITGLLAIAGYSAVRSGAADPAAVGTRASVLIVGLVAGSVVLICVLGLLISTVVWIVSAHRLRSAGPGPVGYGALAGCLVLIVLAYVLSGRVSTVDGSVATEAGLRIGAVLLLVAGVLRVRAQVRRVAGLPVPIGRRTLLTSDDWDASTWDPEVLHDIDRRRPQIP
jgi:hypothetical protein